ncbi:MAG TPA: DUF302 domain-containing protein [Candidatus Paceibacterota bacterium]|nr:DUF302 domain-containing protein [Candidatus Paceibacterota bacterium]
MNYGMSRTIDRPFEEVNADVRAALAAHGFGIVSEIDMQATLHNKIGVEIEPQLILGACNPKFAHRALQAEPSIGLLLPCNVVIRRTDAGTVVEMINPQMMAEITEGPEMKQIADEVTELLSAALASLK